MPKEQSVNGRERAQNFEGVVRVVPENTPVGSGGDGAPGIR